MITPRTLAVLLALTAAPAALAAKTNVVLNGQTHSLDTVVVNGQTYVNLKQLQAALAAPGGANQRVALEGCRNEWLFNGIWRMRVTKVEPIGDPGRNNWPGWGVTVEWRNGTAQTVTLGKTGVEKGTAVAFADGNTWANSEGTAWVDAVFKDVVQGATNTFTYRFWLPDGGDRNAALPAPQKLVITVDPNELKNWSVGRLVKYATPNPSFRVNLACAK